MFFPTPAVSRVYDDLIPMFLDLGFKKHVTITNVCDLLDYAVPIVEEKKKAWYGEENYKCVNPRNETCNDYDVCFRPFVISS